jgi:hypothetical protein
VSLHKYGSFVQFIFTATNDKSSVLTVIILFEIAWYNEGLITCIHLIHETVVCYYYMFRNKWFLIMTKWDAMIGKTELPRLLGKIQHVFYAVMSQVCGILFKGHHLEKWMESEQQDLIYVAPISLPIHCQCNHCQILSIHVLKQQFRLQNRWVWSLRFFSWLLSLFFLKNGMVFWAKIKFFVVVG